jgi:hypothetical protein
MLNTVNYNLNGITLETYSLPWWPYVEVGNCDLNGRNYGAKEIFPEILRTLSELYSFTILYHLEESVGNGDKFTVLLTRTQP